MFCIECGAKNVDAAKFCNACGVELSTPETPVTEGSPRLVVLVGNGDTNDIIRRAKEEPYLDEAAKLWLTAAERGNAEAQFQFGFCLFYGIGVDEDEDEALKWYRKAAKQGYEEAQDQLDKFDFANKESGFDFGALTEKINNLSEEECAELATSLSESLANDNEEDDSAEDVANEYSALLKALAAIYREIQAMHKKHDDMGFSSADTSDEHFEWIETMIALSEGQKELLEQIIPASDKFTADGYTDTTGLDYNEMLRDTNDKLPTLNEMRRLLYDIKGSKPRADRDREIRNRFFDNILSNPLQAVKDLAIDVAKTMHDD